jgi:hypothetical protein
MPSRILPCSRNLAALAVVAFVLGTILTALCAASLAAEYVIHVSVDGLGGPLLQEVIDAGKAPTFKRLEQEGTWTANARTDYTHTNTVPNHTSILTGRPVDQPAGMPNTVQHGYTLNEMPKPDATLHNAGNPNVDYVASVFDVVHDAGRSTALYASKDKFIIFDQSYNDAAGALSPHGRDKIDRYCFHDSLRLAFSKGMNRRFLADMSAHHYDYTFIHYCDPDAMGHVAGWGSSLWQRAVSTVDGYLADVVKLVETDPVLRGHTAIIVTADHGGNGTQHSDSSLPDDYTVPIIVWGAGVGRGDLYAMNAGSRCDPGTSRPDYNAPCQPIRNADTGNLALSLLGLGPIPGSLANAKQDLRVAPVGDYNQDGAVDAADYTVWQDTRDSKTDLRADGNGDGVVDQADYDLWKAHFGRGAAAK